MLSRKSWALSPASQSHLHRVVSGGDGCPRLCRTLLRTCHPALRCRRSAAAEGTDPATTSRTGTLRSDGDDGACCTRWRNIQRGIGNRGSLDARGGDYVCLVQYCFLKLPSALVSTNERFATAISACGDRAKLLHPPKHMNHSPAIRHLTSREAATAHLPA